MGLISISDIIAIGTLLLFNITAIIISWKNTQVKLKEIDVRLESMKNDFNTHCDWDERQHRNNVTRFKELETDNKIEHKEIMIKMDTIISQLNTFMVDIAGKINR